MATKKKSKTKLEQSREKKREAFELEEHFKDVDKRGPDATIEDIKRQESQEKEVLDDQKTDLQGKKEFVSYEGQLANYAQEGLNKIDYPDGWNYDAVATRDSWIRVYGRKFKAQQGVVFVLKSPGGAVMIRAVRTTRDPRIDVKNMETMITQAENTVDSAKGILLSDKPRVKKTPGGIILP